MKTVIIVYMLAFLSSIASAEIYRWEDASGIHFTDNATSVPEKYFEKNAAENKDHSMKSANPVNRETTQQVGPASAQEDRNAIHRANLEQHRLTSEVNKQLLSNSKEFEKTLQSLARFIIIGTILGLSLLVVWAVTIVNIARSAFITPAHKTGWMLVVLFVPLLGMLFYMILGSNQKYISLNSREKQYQQLTGQ